LLFNLEQDPYEQNNLATSDETNLGRLREQLLRLLADTREPYFDVLIEYGVAPDGPTINVSNRQLGQISPAWADMIHTPS
jgi:hypothetical protein